MKKKDFKEQCRIYLCKYFNLLDKFDIPTNPVFAIKIFEDTMQIMDLKGNRADVPFSVCFKTKKEAQAECDKRNKFIKD